MKELQNNGTPLQNSRSGLIPHTTTRQTRRQRRHHAQHLQEPTRLARLSPLHTPAQSHQSTQSPTHSYQPRGQQSISRPSSTQALDSQDRPTDPLYVAKCATPCKYDQETFQNVQTTSYHKARNPTVQKHHTTQGGHTEPLVHRTSRVVST